MNGGFMTEGLLDSTDSLNKKQIILTPENENHFMHLAALIL